MLSTHPWRQMFVALATLVTSVLIILALVLLFKLNLLAATRALDGNVSAVAPSGLTVTATTIAQACPASPLVPIAECLALVEFFTKTQGVQWISKTGWLDFVSGNAPCDWYGVACAAGHVTELVLPRNQLSGTLPLALGDLAGLTRLRLENNGLIGRIPPTLCQLATSLTDANLAYNRLFTKRRSVESCMQLIDPDWQATQTTTVSDLRVSQFYTDALELAWTPISYTVDGGYYEIASTTSVTGPYTLHGHTVDKSASTYLVTGLEPGRAYYFFVRTYTPPHDDQPNALFSNPAATAAVTKAINGRVLVAAYFPADNDLASEIPYVVERLRVGTTRNPNVQVVLLVDGRQDGDTRLLEIANGAITVTAAVAERWGSNELDTADPKVLAWFLQYARTNFPAARTMATLIGHGIALTPEVAWAPAAAAADNASAPRGDIPPLPQEHDYTPSDITNRGYMSTIDVGQALLAATDQGAHPFDLIYFDQCFQGNLDSLYEVHKTARVFVASPNYAWLAAAYDQYLASFTPTATPEEMANVIINRYESALDTTHPNAIFWVRSSDIAAIGAAVSKLGDSLLAATQAGQANTIASAVRQSKYVDTTQCGRQNMQLGPPDELIGLDTFAQNLLSGFGPTDPYGIGTALAQLRVPMERVQKLSRVGNPYIAPEETWNYRDTLTILAPLPRDSPAAVAWRASIYRSDTPFTATWAIDPAQPITVTTALSYTREGRWDDFLAVWFTNLSPTVGAWCHYMPADQVIVAEAEPLTLTATADISGTVAIAWTPTDDTSAIEYRIERIGPHDISWQVTEVVSTQQTAASFAALASGSYRWRVLARNQEQVFVAESNEALIVVPPALPLPATVQLFLPIVNR